ncbi:prokaryotic molybdopterin-containing oxidoreductase family, membrane subunit [Saccharicrinis carchari]|uniref:Prokaryotic molybdopterin-containing oxidoreductase family, membrane subunit n=1 Tax=Saccharicrinis carchari TaxID=1168039 RepID=A0A521CMN9_SACCC|nr:NrfD/PsrC family molybdoenzyme membrane anchor subunit [Saccharicrinis carchari]SMO59960.1 prokaryotic molybdopterin-containing oxidoreductase family, membrane subunit [Saccharicrinis carchari]
MSDHNTKINKEKLDKIATDVLKPVGFNNAFVNWMLFLTMALLACIYAYIIQYNKGLVVTGMRDMVSWGMYIANFVFFVATALVGMLISGVIGLLGYQWIKPITRIAEIIAVAFAAVAGLVIVSDMGRPERLHHVFLYGRVQSPILWDVTVVSTYLVISFLLYLLPLIPDLAIARGRMSKAPKWQMKLYEILSFNWTHHPKQYKMLFNATRVLIILIIPTAFAIHTVTSWLLAVNSRSGWDSTIFGPYFLTGAFVTGMAAVIIAVFFFRNNYKLREYLHEPLFDKMGKLLEFVCVIYFYFNLNEFVVPAYKMKEFDAIHIHELFAGRHAVMFWFSQIFGLVIPMIVLLWKPFRKPLPLFIIALFVMVGAWLKRYIIVIPTMEHPFLPVQFLPNEWVVYQPTVIEGAVTAGSIILGIMIISVLAKLFPVIPIWEMAEEEEETKTKII